MFVCSNVKQHLLGVGILMTVRIHTAQVQVREISALEVSLCPVPGERSVVVLLPAHGSQVYAHVLSHVAREVRRLVHLAVAKQLVAAFAEHEAQVIDKAELCRCVVGRRRMHPVEIGPRLGRLIVSLGGRPSALLAVLQVREVRQNTIL